MRDIVKRLRDGKTVPLMEERNAAADTIEALREEILALRTALSGMIDDSNRAERAQTEQTSMLREWLRENLVLEAALVDPHRDDVRITLRFKGEDDPFTEAVVHMPEKTK